jgi:radical SAM superfamily enzyme YgiQ (UPF0313 family)
LKILLIYPYFLEDRLNTEDIQAIPIGLFYVAAMLRKNHFDVDILNWHRINQTPHQIYRVLEEKQPDMIGFSILNANRGGAIEIAKIAKKLNPSVKIVFGGIGAAFLWNLLLEHYAEIDFVVMGEGEYPLLELATRLKDKEDQAIGTIPGIAFRQGDRIRRTASTEPITDLDSLPNPAEYYRYQHVALSRGCPDDCTFCGSPRFWKRKVRFHSAEYFVRQIELLYQKGITFFFISDDTFTRRKDLVIDICRRILKKNMKITWAAISRVNYVNAELLYWMRRAGCIQISYGVESGDEKIRAYLNKPLSTQQIKTAFRLTQAHGIMARAYFIYGCPGETRDTIQASMDLISDIKPLSAIFYILDIYPGTALYRRYLEEGRFSEDIWLNPIEDLLYFEIDPTLTKEMILEFGKTLRQHYYQSLPNFVDRISLVDKKELFPLHADFLSRLGLTFHQGDYARKNDIPNNIEIAEKLYRRSLEYHPDARAYLGLGMIRQQEKNLEASMTVLEAGIRRFPDDLQLHLCMAVSRMNSGDYDEALHYLDKFNHSRQALYYMAECYNAMGDFEKAAEFRQRSTQVPD